MLKMPLTSTFYQFEENMRRQPGAIVHSGRGSKYGRGMDLFLRKHHRHGPRPSADEIQ